MTGARPDARPIARYVALGARAAAIALMATTAGRAGEAVWATGGAIWRVQDSGVPQPPRRPTQPLPETRTSNQVGRP